MGLDLDELNEGGELDEWKRTRASGARRRDGRICICGHSAGRHAVHEVGEREITRCTVGRNSHCACGSLQPVLDVRDTRVFLCGTEGPHAQHALVKGLALLQAKYPGEALPDLAEELVEFACNRCGSTERVWPIAVDRSGRVSSRTEKVNGLACAACLADLPRAR